MAEANSSPLPPVMVRIARPARIIPTALHAGSDEDGSPLYIARPYICGSYQLSKAGPNLPTALFPHDGEEIPVEGEFDVLVPAPGLGWTKFSPENPIPNRVVPLGVEGGELLYGVRSIVSNAG
ncbi:hypothetical protein BDK51DRAFT_47080 [Blyttiomyces helicus]|uniref:Uncharacterized protein n=1 Tax=Blyttiomyces helicus TaxID=388810 RepID=A0A4P9W2H9_9FUNG|nr:hypothetical protein BDK51DRAFT_47080 [Blyttiomyces helicus]|eukprot:RKO84998.1 hypothetical protein BDK51DRAFT_47080 [Blyttiomyces helicus]